MNDIQKQCKDIIKKEGINLQSSIDYEVNGEVHSLSIEWIIDSYMQASDEAQLVFLTALKKAVSAKEMGIDKFFEGMGQLLLMTHLSDKLEV